MAPPAPDAAGLAQLLALSKVGTFSLPIANLQHTAIGRPLHRVGVSSIRTSIEDQGWLDSKMTACLVGPTPVGGLEAADVAEQQQYRILDGNHRLAALLEIEAERKKADPSCEPTFIGVEVHVGMSLEKERIVASSECCDWVLSVLLEAILLPPSCAPHHCSLEFCDRLQRSSVDCRSFYRRRVLCGAS